MTLRILVGHVLDRLRELPPESVHCVVTSPPYYGLRDYGIEPQVWDAGKGPGGHMWDNDIRSTANDSNRGSMEWTTGGNPAAKVKGERVSQGAFCLRCGAWRGSLGLEPTLALYLDHMTEVFREVRRVMRRDATCWLNIGDSYTSGGRATYGTFRPDTKQATNPAIKSAQRPPAQDGLKPKDLMLIPARLAIRLQDDGWWVRSDIAWCKRAPMPESCTDRPTSAWEHVFLLTRSAKYFYDAEAVKEEEITPGKSAKEIERQKKLRADRESKHRKPTLVNDSISWGGDGESYNSGKRNLRNFWLLGPEPFPEAHFATYPTEIPRRAILAGTSERGVCPKCAAPWERVNNISYEKTTGSTGGRRREAMPGDFRDDRLPKLVKSTETVGWRPTCGCAIAETSPATILDCFGGSGTSGLVADRLGRDAILVELNPEYAAMARRRIEGDAGLFAEVAD